MQNTFLESLLKFSRDFILIVNHNTLSVRVGDHFLTALRKNGVSEKEFSAMITEQSNGIFDKEVLMRSLHNKGIFCSTFSSLNQDKEKNVLLAADLGLHEVISKMTKERRNKEDRVHVLLDESSDPIFSFDSTGRYLYVNRIFAKTVNKEQEDIIGKKIWDVFPKKEADKRFAMVKQVFETGETGSIEVKVALPDHSNKVFLTTVKPINDESGNVSFIICISKDITELRKAQDEIKILQGIIPICSSCKLIRDDGGYWQQIEEYITNHSEAQFSHGVCPDCTEKLYPGVLDEETLDKFRPK